jgi:DNA-binding transcriptional LysR family regulator
MNISLERVLRFVTVAEHMSITRAAEKLGIDQPWLSRQVIQLEEQLGFTLFERTGSRLVLTRAGDKFLEVAKEMAETVNKVRNTATEMSRCNEAQLEIGVCDATFPVPSRHQLIAAFAQLRPQVRLEFSAYANSDEVADRVESGELDFGIVFEPVFALGTMVCMLEPIDQSLAVPEEDPLAQQESIALAELAGRTVANSARDRMQQRYRYAYSWVEQVGATLYPVIEGRRYVPNAAAKERMFYICYTPADVVPPGFVNRPIRGPKPYLSVCLIRSKRLLSSAGERLWRLGHELRAKQQREQPVALSVDPIDKARSRRKQEVNHRPQQDRAGHEQSIA